MGGERSELNIDQVWVERFLISTRCQNAAAERERLLCQIETLSPPCRDEYLRHRRVEIIKQLSLNEQPQLPPR